MGWGEWGRDFNNYKLLDNKYNTNIANKVLIYCIFFKNVLLEIIKL